MMKETVLSRSLRLMFSGSVVVGLGLLAQPAMAQEATSADAPQRIVVTGSMISRATKETPSPVQTLTADDLAKSGFTTVSEVLTNITANGQGALAQGFSGAFARGASGVSLRGMTVGATLVLIDGHRMAPYPLSDDGQRAFVDVSSIPFDAVERIEVLKDGASSVYGSDAIAGVVNIILKKSVKGTTVSGDAGTTQHGGGKNTHFTVTSGVGDLATDGYNLFGSFEYRHSDPIRIADRNNQDWANGNWSSRGGVNTLPGVPNAINGFRTATNTPFLFDQTGAGGVNNPANFKFLTSDCDYTRYMAGACAVPVVGNIQPETRNMNGLVGFTKNLAGDWKLAVKASLFSSEDKNNRGMPLTNSVGSFAGFTSLVPGQAPKIVGVIPSFLAPANYPGNTYGYAVRLYGYLPSIGPTVNTDTTTVASRAVADLSGSIGEWNINAAVGYTNVETKIDYAGYVNRTALYAALTRASNPLLLTAPMSAADLAAISPKFNSKATDELDFAEFRAGRDLMQLDGGALGFSAGLSFVHKKLNSPPPDLLANGIVGNGAAFASGTENNSAAFFELNAPVLKNLELNASGRIDHFDTYGNSSTPKVGFKYAPFQSVTVRGTYSKGFRAPNAAENGTAGSIFNSNAVNDPILCKDGKTTTAGNVVAACNMQPAYVQVTTKDLQPEKSTSATLGLILEPIKGWETTLDYYKIEVKNQIATASGLPDYVPTFVRGDILPTVISDGGTASHIGLPSVGQIAYATSGYVNAGSTKTTGIELDTSYRFKLGEYGSLKTGLQFTHMISYVLSQNGVSYELAGTHGPSVIGGDTGSPKNRAQVLLGYDRGPLNVTTTFNWVSDYTVLDPSVGANDCATAANEQSGRNYFNGPVSSGYCKVSSFVSTNLSVTYKYNKNLTFKGTVQNLFDRAPPIDIGTYGNASAQTAYNATLHQAGAVGRAFNLGATYKF